MNLKDDLITQIFNILEVGLDYLDDGSYKHNIRDISLTDDNEITVWAEDYDGETLMFTLELGR
jgi:hypothetical protein